MTICGRESENRVMGWKSPLQAQVNKRDLPGSCTTLSLSQQLLALSLPLHGSVLVCRPQLLDSLGFPLALRRAALPGLRSSGSPFPAAPSPTGPPGASVPSPAPVVQSSPDFAVPVGQRRADSEFLRRGSRGMDSGAGEEMGKPVYIPSRLQYIFCIQWGKLLIDPLLNL